MNYGTIVFTKDDFGSELWSVIGQQLQLLLKAGYEARVRYDEPGLEIVVIEFGYDANLEDYGMERLMWVTAEEEEEVLGARRQ